jgi:hypothetical protein
MPETGYFVKKEVCLAHSSRGSRDQHWHWHNNGEDTIEGGITTAREPMEEELQRSHAHS